MDQIVIEGGLSLNGKILVSGSKNASLPIIAASLLTDKNLELNNIPYLEDINSMLELLEGLGINCDKSQFYSYKKLILSSKNITSYIADYNLVRKMRASFLVLGPLLSREGKAKVSLPGGCAIGTRPVNLHLEAMKSLGANIELKDGYVFANTNRLGLIGNKINFQKVSVGATENAIMAAILAKGETRISNAAIEPEVVDLCNFLNSIGAKISDIGKKTIFIQGVDNLKAGSYSVIPDRIEACTFIIAAAITKGNLEISNINSFHIKNFLKVMDAMGLNYENFEKKVIVRATKKLNPTYIKTKEFPGFPTDLQAQIMTLTCMADGISEIEENIFENRFMHVPELIRLGADIKIKGKKAVINGNRKFVGAEVMATDLRASVSLVLAGLVAKGKTKINRIYHLDRGYEEIEKKLAQCGANILRVKK